MRRDERGLRQRLQSFQATGFPYAPSVMTVGPLYAPYRSGLCAELWSSACSDACEFAHLDMLKKYRLSPRRQMSPLCHCGAKSVGLTSQKQS